MPEPYIPHIANLRAMRHRARMTQDELAARAAVSRTSIYMAERPGAPAPSLRIQRRVAEVLGVDAEAIWPTEREAA